MHVASSPLLVETRLNTNIDLKYVEDAAARIQDIVFFGFRAHRNQFLVLGPAVGVLIIAVTHADTLNS
jgi:hypothetical protein